MRWTGMCQKFIKYMALNQNYNYLSLIQFHVLVSRNIDAYFNLVIFIV